MYLDEDERFREQKSLCTEQPSPAYVPHSDIETHTLKQRSTVYLDLRTCGALAVD